MYGNFISNIEVFLLPWMPCSVFSSPKLRIARQDFCRNLLLYWKAVKGSSILRNLKIFLKNSFWHTSKKKKEIKDSYLLY